MDRSFFLTNETFEGLQLVSRNGRSSSDLGFLLLDFAELSACVGFEVAAFLSAGVLAFFPASVAADRFGSSTGAIGSSFDRSASVGADGASVAAGSFTGASGSADSSRFSGAEIGTTGGSSSSSSFSGSSFSADAPVATGSSGSQIEVTGTSETDSGAAGASSTSFERTEFTKISSPSSSAVSSSAGLPPRMDGIAPDAASGAGLDVEKSSHGVSVAERTGSGFDDKQVRRERANS
ncbi:unnamed protein product [Bursaphelenchus xylophilus]|uniref:(pine wood nematode) hypothetical protein n=1 Tax=Bursaphelenchus xylophilus TaxID=6326 RepID=A0A1I7SAS8_BURXY|nr:unnamed protein product [Bursaphelenchus xylophilus]CAG9126807.1 unnamed protein product [Bursaphelenchus xylophilus]